MSDPRMYPDRPYLAVSAAIIRDGHVLVARRAKGASTGLYTLPGGVVEAGETLHQALVREIAEETGITIEPVAVAGHREIITRDESGRVSRHLVILCFAACAKGRSGVTKCRRWSMPRPQVASGASGWSRASTAVTAGFSKPIALARRPPTTQSAAISTKARRSRATSPRAMRTKLSAWP